MKLPPPVVEEHNGFFIVRDDLIEGGSKRRVAPLLLGTAAEYVYASPATGYAQLAVALSCRDAGKRATIFVAQSKELAPLTQQAKDAGAKIEMVKMGFLRNVQDAAARYVRLTEGAKLLPFGFDHKLIRDGFAAVARSIPMIPTEVWTVAGSGVLTRSLQLAWPDADFHVVKVGKEDIDTGRAKIYRCERSFSQPAKVKPPFPSAPTYDGKCWEFMLKYASPGAWFWNVGK